MTKRDANHPTGADAVREPTRLKGQFAVAMPHLSDPNFQHTVVLLCEHNKEGAMGVVVNRPMPFLMEQVYEGQGIEGGHEGDAPVHFGGPVQPEVGFILFEGDALIEGSMDVGGGIGLSTSLEMLREISEGVGPKRFLFCLGYAGWGPEQLENEIARNDWLVVPLDPEIVFSLPAEERWEHAFKKLGITPGLLSQTMGNA